MTTSENLPQTQKTKTDLTIQHDLSIIEQVVMQGNLANLNPEQRVTYYHKVCESLGLNPYTKPFAYIRMNGELQLYAKKDATEQLRNVKNISIIGLEGRVVDDLFIVKAKASMPNGRTDESTSAVTIGNLKGDAKANAIMKAETKAKRRVTLSIAGLGWTDETEIETISSAVKVNVDFDTGEIQNEIKHNPETIKTFTLDAPPVKEMPKEELISFDQLTEIMKGMAKMPEDVKENYKKYMKTTWNVSEYEYLPTSAFEPTMKAIERVLKTRGNNE